MTATKLKPQLSRLSLQAPMWCAYCIHYCKSLTTKVSCGKLFHTCLKCDLHKQFNILACRIAVTPLGNFYCPSEFSYYHSVFAQTIPTGSHCYLYYSSAFSITPQFLSQPSRIATMRRVTMESQISPSQEVLKLCHVFYSRQRRRLSSWVQRSQTPLPLSDGLCKHPPGLIGSHPREQ